MSPDPWPCNRLPWHIRIHTLHLLHLVRQANPSVVSKGAVAIFVDIDVVRIKVSNGGTVIPFPIGLIKHLSADSTRRHSRGGATDVSIPRGATIMGRVWREEEDIDQISGNWSVQWVIDVCKSERRSDTMIKKAATDAYTATTSG